MLEKIIELLLGPASLGKPGGLMIQGPVILVVPAFIVLIAAVVASFVWLCRDAKKRNKNVLVTLLFILLTGWPASFLWWFWLRPPVNNQANNI